ncbi:MAG: zinc dependent phospholipase C family protein [Chloroflexi bacterium]|nr:zinc dependent phospholipase C family protein [Chloroflexota bacterium]
MPNLGLHIGFALEAKKRLRHPVLDEHQGSFLLGCTSPDVRLFAGWQRERTHFFKLATDPAGAGIEGMLRANPHLEKSERLSRETVAFLLGYMSHLNCDETWICDVYRRFFGKGSPMEHDPLVHVLDRALQFELDRRERESIKDLEGALKTIEGAWAGVDVGFIDKPLLQEWQGVVIKRSGRDMPWERFRGFVSRIHPKATDGEVEWIIGNIPALLEKVREHINDDEVQAFRESAIQAFLTSAERYLHEGQIS